MTQYRDLKGDNSLGTSPKDKNAFGKTNSSFLASLFSKLHLKGYLKLPIPQNFVNANSDAPSGLWPDTVSNELVEQTARMMGNGIDEIATSMCLLHDFPYINYANPSRDPIESYGKRM
jgi:hypothetical protein